MAIAISYVHSNQGSEQGASLIDLRRHVGSSVGDNSWPLIDLY